MPIFPLGNTMQADVLISDAIVLGDVSLAVRPGVPDQVRVVFPIIRPPVGYLAKFLPLLPPALILNRSVVSGVDGHVVTLTLVNNIAPMFYTLDGSAPVNGPTVNCFRYVGPFPVKFPTYPRDGATITVKTRAFSLPNSGFTDSVIDTFTLQIPRKPILTYDVDNTGSALTKDISILPDFSGDYTIRYTTDGSLPNLTSTVYGGPFQITGISGGSITLKAIAFPNNPIGLTGGILQSDLATVFVSFVP